MMINVIYSFKTLEQTILCKTHLLNILWINTTGATSGAGTAYPSGAPEFILGF